MASLKRQKYNRQQEEIKQYHQQVLKQSEEKKQEYHTKVKGLKATKKKYLKQLAKINGVVGVGLRVYEEKIVVYCEEVTDDLLQSVPKTLDGYEVLVLDQGGALEPTSVIYDRAFRRPVGGGTSVGHPLVTVGTLGSWWYSNTLGKPVGISNNHVLASQNQAKGRRVVTSTINCTYVVGGNENFVPVLADKKLSTFQHDIQQRPSTINSIAPTSFQAGQEVTIKGDSLGFRWGYSKVYFNGIEAPVKSWTATGSGAYDLSNNYNYSWVDSTIVAYVPKGLTVGSVTISVEVEGDPILSPGKADDGTLATNAIGMVETYIPLAAGVGKDIAVMSPYDESTIDSNIYLRPPIVSGKLAYPTYENGWVGYNGSFDTSKTKQVEVKLRNFPRGTNETALQVNVEFLGQAFEEVVFGVPVSSVTMYDQVDYDVYVPVNEWSIYPLYVITMVADTNLGSMYTPYDVVNYPTTVVVNGITYAKIHVTETIPTGLVGSNTLKIKLGTEYSTFNGSVFVDDVVISDASNSSIKFNFAWYHPFDDNESFKPSGFVAHDDIVEGLVMLKVGRTTGATISRIFDVNYSATVNYSIGATAFTDLILIDTFYKNGVKTTSLSPVQGGDSGSSAFTCPVSLFDKFYDYYGALHGYVDTPTNVVFHTQPYSLIGNVFASSSSTNMGAADKYANWEEPLGLALEPYDVGMRASGISFTSGSASLELGASPLTLSASGQSTSSGSALLELGQVVTNDPNVFELVAYTDDGIFELVDLNNLVVISPIELSAIGNSTSSGSATLLLINPIQLSASGQSISSGSAKLILPLDLSAAGMSTTSGSAILVTTNKVDLSATGLSLTSGSALLVAVDPLYLSALGQSVTSGSATLTVIEIIELGSTGYSLSSGFARLSVGNTSYLDNYRNRVGANPIERFINQSKRRTSELFRNNPFYQLISVNGSEFDSIVAQGKTSEDKTILFKPDVDISKGAICEIGSNFYILKDFQGEGIHDIYPTATAKLCNSKFPVKRNKTRISLGVDADGRPVTIDSYAEEYLEPCIAETTYPSVDGNSQLPLPEGNINITMKYQLADNIVVNQNFEMYGQTYEIVNIDYTNVVNDKGIMIIRGKREVVS